MARKKKKLPSVNSSSMADIAFLLLIFFLVTSSMDTDTGLARQLPPPPQSEEKVVQKVEQRNILLVMVSANNEAKCGDDIYANEAELLGKIPGKPALKDKVKEFILNSRNSPDLPALVEEEFDAPIGNIMYTKYHVISLSNDMTTSYSAYIMVQNELVKAYNELREEAARKYYHKPYDELTQDEKAPIRQLYKQRISEAEPVNYGGN